MQSRDIVYGDAKEDSIVSVMKRERLSLRKIQIMKNALEVQVRMVQEEIKALRKEFEGMEVER